ncbi:hypothetical protein ACOME3_000705 [Neoechinorhynchus agilis]
MSKSTGIESLFIKYLFTDLEMTMSKKEDEKIQRSNPLDSDTYKDLITMSIASSLHGYLTQHGIYIWIIQNFEYFRQRQRFSLCKQSKSATRHSPSINEKFYRFPPTNRKRPSLWAINPNYKKGIPNRKRSIDSFTGDQGAVEARRPKNTPHHSQQCESTFDLQNNPFINNPTNTNGFIFNSPLNVPPADINAGIGRNSFAYFDKQNPEFGFQPLLNAYNSTAVATNPQVSTNVATNPTYGYQGQQLVQQQFFNNGQVQNAQHYSNGYHGGQSTYQNTPQTMQFYQPNNDFNFNQQQPTQNVQISSQDQCAPQKYLNASEVIKRQFPVQNEARDQAFEPNSRPSNDPPFTEPN